MGTRTQEELLRQLVIRAREGDKRSYGKIFRLCYKDIYDYVIRRVGNRSDAEDLTMQVFMQGLKSVSSYEERGHSVKAWLYRIAHNAVVDHLRARRQSFELDEVQEAAADTDVLADLLAREDIGRVYGEVADLPPAQAEVLILRFMEDMSVSETAMILDKKEVTVRALQFKGIKNLRKRMEGKEQADEGPEQQGDGEMKKPR